MLFKSVLVAAAAVTGAMAQRPSNISVCDYYTTALLKNNTAANQKTLLTLVVNTAVIGNYTQPNVGISVPGILAPGTYNGTAVNLLPYFNGGLASSNRGGMSGVSINFLDGGAAAPLMMNMPANDTTSNQFMLLTHLYEYFGVLLGCTLEGTDSAYPAYTGQSSQYSVHKFMDLTAFEVGYFITQVALSAASFGVAQDDLTSVGAALGMIFGYRCSPPTVVVPSQGAQLQSICTDPGTCVVNPVGAVCQSYASNVTKPVSASGSAAGGGSTATATATSGGSSSASGSATGSAPASVKTAGAVSVMRDVVSISFVAVVGGVVAMFM